MEPTTAVDITPLRALYRYAMNCQIVHDSLHERGYTVPWRVRVDGRIAGYGTVAGFGDEPKDMVNEFHVLPAWRGVADRLFAAFVRASGARRIQAQTNDVLLTTLLFDRARSVEREKILFADGFDAGLVLPGATVRRVEPGDRDGLFEHEDGGHGEWLLAVDGEIVATGGYLSHYNPPFSDLYMEVAPQRRRRGFGAYLVQQLKRACYADGGVPAARCSPSNHASRATLQKAGLLPCGQILVGILREPAAG